MLSFLKDVEVGDVIDESSGNAVYDSSTETIGDGNQDANLNSVSTKTLGSGRHYAGAYSGNDPDARLDAALSAASVGDKIYIYVNSSGGVYQRFFRDNLGFVFDNVKSDGTETISDSWAE